MPAFAGATPDFVIRLRSRGTFLTQIKSTVAPSCFVVCIGGIPPRPASARRRAFLVLICMSEKLEVAKRYRHIARETRSVALATKSPKDRDSLLNLAYEYERMARELEAEHASAKILGQSEPLRVAHSTS